MSHVKTIDGYDIKVPNQGQVSYNTVAGSAGLASFLGLNAQNLFGGWGRNGYCAPVCSDDHVVSRYELKQEQTIAAKDSEIALLKANTYNDQKTLELYRYIDGQLNSINNRLAAQDVRNQGVSDAIREVSKDIDYKVNLEAERRCCSDQRVVSYVNGTFAPKSVVDYKPDSTSTLMPTYNPLCCGCEDVGK